VGALGLNKRVVLVSIVILVIAIAAVSGTVLGNLNTNAPSKGTVMLTIQGDSRVYSSSGTSIPFS